MGKNNRHKKLQREEKSKVKLKGTKKLLPKGQNVTDTSFKVKKIVINEQLKQANSEELLSRKKLGIKELLSHLQHHNVTFRQNGLTGLKELLTLHLDNVIQFHLTRLVEAISMLVLDQERDIRRSAIKLLHMVLKQISTDLMAPVFSVLQSYLSCAMTHIKPAIQEDALLLLDTLLKSCPTLIAANSNKILQCFLDMFSNLRTESKPGRMLTVNLGSKLTSVRWRIKVLSHLNGLLTAVVNEKKRNNVRFGLKDSNRNVEEIVWSKDMRLNIPVLSAGVTGICHLPGLLQSSVTTFGSISDESKELQGYVQILMPLLIETWLEIAPREISEEANILSNESAVLLQCILGIIRLIWEYLECSEAEAKHYILTEWFKSKYEHDIKRHFLPGFPYAMMDHSSTPRSKKSKMQQHKELEYLLHNVTQTGPKCLQQNLSFCYLICCVHNGKDQELCDSVVRHITECVDRWEAVDDPFLPEMERLLRMLLLRCGEIWTGTIDLLEHVITCQTQAPNGLAQMLFQLLCSLVLQPRLQILHRCPQFEHWLTLLPDILSQTSVSIKAVDTLSRLASQGNKLFLESLQMKSPSIINNLSQITVIGASSPIAGQKAIINILFWVTEWRDDVHNLIDNNMKSGVWVQDVVNYVLEVKALRKLN